MDGLRQSVWRHSVILLGLGGCSLYQPELLGDQRAITSGGEGQGATGAIGSVSEGGVNATRGGAAGGGAASGGGAAGLDEPPLSGAGGSAGGEAPEPPGVAGANEGGATPCVPETFSEFCARVGKNCDVVTGTDNCGNALDQVNCGSCAGYAKCGGAGQDNVCGALTGPGAGGIATASSVGTLGEDGSRAFDGDQNTKWFAGDGNKLGWLAYQFSGASSHVVESYSLTSANDVAGRDPSAWELQGSNNGSTWVMVDQRSAQVFAMRHQTRSFTCQSSPAYRWYRLFITANSGANEVQLAELVLYGR